MSGCLDNEVQAFQVIGALTVEFQSPGSRLTDSTLLRNSSIYADFH